MSVHSSPLGDTFLRFAGESGAPYDTPEIREWMETHDLGQSKRVLAALGFVLTGCWRRPRQDGHVVWRLLSDLETIHDIQNEDTRQEVQAGLAAHLERIDDQSESRKNWLHSHRYTHLGTKFPSGDATDVAVDITQTLQDMSTAIDEPTLDAFLDNRIAQFERPFWAAFVELSNDNQSSISSFPRLPTFDFLELVHRAAGKQDLYPREPKFDYIESNNPLTGFAHVFLGETLPDDLDRPTLKHELGVTDEELERLFGQLVRRCEEELGWPEQTTVFDVESCLCIFAKDADHRKGGANDDGRAGGSGC